jgi:hypothetical protein
MTYVTPSPGDETRTTEFTSLPRSVTRKTERTGRFGLFLTTVGVFSYTNPVRLSHEAVFLLGRPSMMLLTLCRSVWK